MEGEYDMAQKGEDLEIDAEMFESLIRRLFEEKGILKRRDSLSLHERWCKHLGEQEQFWGKCLKVARPNPYLYAEAVDCETALTMLGLKPEPADERLK